MSEHKEKQGAQSLSQREVAVAPEAEAATKSAPKLAERAAECLGADDIWRCARGAFRAYGGEGTGIYEYGGVNYANHLILWDCLDVGLRQGWTYRVAGVAFVIFLSRFANDNGKYQILTSHDNENFSHYCWAD